MNKTFKSAMLLLMIAVALALVVNTFSPAGIPLFGKWDEAEDGSSANENDGRYPVSSNIVNIETSKSFFDRGNSLFIDARSSDAYDDGHIKGAVSLPVSAFDMKIGYLLDHYPPDQLIVIYCADISCKDGRHLARMLVDVGYENVLVMTDGFVGWDKKGFPVE